MSSSSKHDSPAGGSLSHVLSWQLLIGVLVILMFLTWLTVFVRGFDLGGFNLAAALVIASVKAALVMAIFMHLRWDKPFNVLLFLSSFIFAALFISLALLDKSEYEPDINEMSTRAAEGR